MDISVILFIVVGEISTILLTAVVFLFIYKRKLASSLRELKDSSTINTSNAFIQPGQTNPNNLSPKKQGTKLYRDYIQEELSKLSKKFHKLKSTRKMTLSLNEPKKVHLISLRYYTLKTELESLVSASNSDIAWTNLDKLLKKHLQIYFHNNDPTVESVKSTSSRKISDQHSSTSIKKKSNKLFDDKINPTNIVILDENHNRKYELLQQLEVLTDQMIDNTVLINILLEIQILDDCVYNFVKNSEYKINDNDVDYQPKDKHINQIDEIKDIDVMIVEKNAEIVSSKKEIEKTEEKEELKNCISLLNEQIENYNNKTTKTDDFINMLKHELDRSHNDLTRFKRLSSTPRIEQLEKAVLTKGNDIENLKNELLECQNKSDISVK